MSEDMPDRKLGNMSDRMPVRMSEDIPDETHRICQIE